MTKSEALKFSKEQKIYWRQEMESTLEKMNSYPADSPEHIQWKKQYELACRIYNRMYDKPKEEN